ncbi:MAG TPA: methyl-accepting chemotaxis protein [Epulopiscium sp.]|nr:methyl-accepting chemotaxis protein [Candidatus Epulonipiscium sp.]
MKITKMDNPILPGSPIKKVFKKKRHSGYNPIKKQLILQNLAMISIICIIVSTCAYHLSKKALLGNSELMLQELAVSTSAQIEQSLMRYIDMAQTLAQDKALTSDEVYMRDKISVLTRNHTLFNHNSVGIVNLEGECRDSSGVILDVDDEEYFQKAINGESYISAPYLARDTGELEVVYAVPIREIDDQTEKGPSSLITEKIQFGEVVGVLVIKRPGSDFIDIANSIGFGESGTTQIIDQYGTIIAHEDTMFVEEQINLTEEESIDPSLYGLQEIHKQMLHTAKGVGAYNYNQTEKTIAYAPIEFTGWTVGVSADTKELLEQVPILAMWLLVFAIGCMVLGVIMATLMSNTIVKRLKKIKGNVMQLAEGDFTRIAHKNKVKDEITDISDAVEKTKEDIVKIIENIKESSNHLDEEYMNLLAVAKEFSQVSEGISISVGQASQGSYSQAVDLSNVNEKFIYFNEKITRSVEQIQEISISSDTIFDRAGTSNSDMERLSLSMNEIGRSFDDVEISIHAMKTSMDQVAKITNIINDIAEQTNLLSLNATIEAARAGEAGKGFNVVAGEIRKLSQQSKEALHQIQGAVYATIHETKVIIEKTDIMKDSLQGGVIDIDKGIVSFNAISQLVMEMVPKIKEIATNTNQIAEDKQDITINIENISNVSEEISATTQEITSAMEGLVKSSTEVEDVAKRLSAHTVKMRQATNEFKI